MNRTRRAVLVGAGTGLAAGLAGCSSGDEDSEDSEDGGDGETAPQATEATATETPTPSVTQIVDEQLRIAEDDYASWQFYVGGRFELNYEFTVTTGSAIDVFVVEHRQFSRYESQQQFDAAVTSEALESDSVSAELPEGTYHLIVDHTPLGRAEPPGGLGKDPVDVEIVANYEQL